MGKELDLYNFLEPIGGLAGGVAVVVDATFSKGGWIIVETNPWRFVTGARSAPLECLHSALMIVPMQGCHLAQNPEFLSATGVAACHQLAGSVSILPARRKYTWTLI